MVEKYQGWQQNEAERRNPAVPIEPASSPGTAGWSHYHKISMQIPNAIVAPIEFDESGEVAIYATRAITIAVDNPSKWMGPATTFRLKGRIRRIFIDPAVAHSITYLQDRVTLYIGRPDLGFNFMPDDPRRTRKEKLGIALAPWAAGADTVASAAIIYPSVIPMPMNPTGRTTRGEANWIFGIEWTRTAGNVEGFQFAESVTGAATRILTYRLQNPSDRGCVLFPDPFMLTCEGIWYMYGSIEAVITACTLHIIETIT